MDGRTISSTPYGREIHISRHGSTVKPNVSTHLSVKSLIVTALQSSLMLVHTSTVKSLIVTSSCRGSLQLYSVLYSTLQLFSSIALYSIHPLQSPSGAVGWRLDVMVGLSLEVERKSGVQVKVLCNFRVLWASGSEHGRQLEVLLGWCMVAMVWGHLTNSNVLSAAACIKFKKQSGQNIKSQDPVRFSLYVKYMIRDRDPSGQWALEPISFVRFLSYVLLSLPVSARYSLNCGALRTMAHA